ncbi:MAG: MarR family transcriptional regulator [Ruminiclostridium sp.]|nr:MarR family transcriptional regulator [Ruminiclostridium sp.]
MKKKNEMLRLGNQLCFPLYACSREIVKKYNPLLEELGLTYTQYIVMLVMWEDRRISVKRLGERLYLDSGTLTPVLKSLEAKGFVTRTRSAEDERVLIVDITPEGDRLEERAAEIPPKIACCVSLEPDEAAELHRLLYKVLGGI